MKLDKSERTPIVEQCKTASLLIIPDPKNKEKNVAIKVACPRIDGEFCSTYLFPDKKWKSHKCPFSQEEVIEEQERILNPLKASKRASGK